LLYDPDNFDCYDILADHGNLISDEKFYIASIENKINKLNIAKNGFESQTKVAFFFIILRISILRAISRRSSPVKFATMVTITTII